MPQTDLDRLVAIWLDQFDAGTELSPADLCATHGCPELVEKLAEEIRFLKKLEAGERHSGAGNLSTFLANLAGQGETVTSSEQVPPPSNTSYATPTDFGDYEILGEIARGGMGVVYRARQKGLDRIVALKMILGGKLASELDVKRFYTVAEAAARLDHPGIVPIYEVNRTNDQHFYAMGYVDGPSLAAKIGGEPSSPRVAAELLIEIAEAVEYAHQQGVIHRDLKPQNILLTLSGSPKITDFGLAKRLGSDSNLTSSGQILGTPNYMAPEQAAGKTDEIDARADVYALGGILYCMLVGRPPFQGKSLAETLYQVQFQELTSPTQLNPKVHHDLATICAKALAKSPGSRYASAAAFADDLRRFCNGEPILARREGWWSYLARRAKRNRVACLSLAVVALVVTLASWFVWRSSDAYQLAALNQQLEAELDSKLVTAESLAKLDGLVQAIARVAPETEPLTRQRIADKLVASIQQQIDRPRLSQSDVAEIQRQIEVAGRRSPALAPPLSAALQRRVRRWETVFEIRPPFADVSKVFPTLHVSKAGDSLARAAAPVSVVLSTVPSDGNVTLEAEFPPADSRESIGLILAGRQGNTEQLSALQFTSDGARLLTGSRHREPHQPGELRLWDVERGTLLSAFRLPVAGEPLAVMLPDNRCFVAIRGGTQLWKLGLDDGRWEDCTAHGNGERIVHLEASSSGKQVAIAAIRPDSVTKIDLWNAEDRPKQPLRPLGTSQHDVKLLRFHKSELELVWYSEKSLDGVSLANGQARKPQECANLIDLSPDLKTALVCANGYGQLRDVAGGGVVNPVSSLMQAFSGSAFAPDNQMVIFPETLNSVGYSLANGKPVFELHSAGGHSPAAIQHCRFSSDGKRLGIASADGGVVVWDVTTHRQLARMGEAGYFFLLHSPPQPSGQAVLELRRNNIALRRQEVPLPEGKLRLVARREGNVLSFQINDLPAVEFRDAFPLPADASGRFGLVLGATDHVLQLQGRRQGRATNPSPLESADDLYAGEKYAQAIEIYTREANSAADPAIVQEANYKLAMCLLAVGRKAEADELLSNLAGQTGDRWPPNAACQLWLHRLRDKHAEQAEQLLESLTLRYRFEELAGMIPEDVRAEILHEYSRGTVGTNLFLPNPNRVQQAERAAAVQKLLFRSGGEWDLLRAYHGSGQLDTALRYAEKIITEVRGPIASNTPLDYGFTGSIFQEYLWLLRLQGRAAEALVVLDGWPKHPYHPADYDQACRAVDRVRLLEALGRSAEAESEAAKARLTMRRYLVKSENLSFQSNAKMYHRHLGLMLGILLDRRGDASAASALWRSEIESNWEKAELNMNVIYDHIGSSLPGEMTTGQSAALLGRILGSVGGAGKVVQVSGIGDTIAPAFAGMFRSPRGKQAAYDILFRNVSLPDTVRLYPQLAAYETFRRSLLSDSSPPGHEPIIWDVCARGMDSYRDGKLGSELIVPLVLSWKGTNNFLGWGAAAPALSKEFRGPLAFLMGLRYERLSRKKEAIEFFRQAEQDGGADSPLAREAMAERFKLE